LARYAVKTYFGKSKYKYVYINVQGTTQWFVAKIPSLKFEKWCRSETEAARLVDVKLVMNGLEPVNVLKRV